MGYHRKSLFYSHYNTMLPIFIKALYHPPFLNLHQGLISKSMQQSKVGKFRKRVKLRKLWFPTRK